ncbi:MAG: hypothetical protein CEE38_02390 [Planctomycetes bacterium B3_Pla]|nr:MAG: hypothetical protein CEE38_02390 [Planctomycetes bacterium B3_Pla]
MVKLFSNKPTLSFLSLLLAVCCFYTTSGLGASAEEAAQVAEEPPAAAEEPNEPPAAAEEPNEPPTEVEEPNEPPAEAQEPNEPPAVAQEPNEPPAAAEEPNEPPTEAEEPNEPPAEAQEPNEPPAADPSTVVARIGYYNITREELEKRLLMELRPSDYDYYDEDTPPADAKTVLMKMVAEKAMVFEARTKDYLQDEQIQATIKRFRERRLKSLLAVTHVEGKVTVTEAEIKQKMQTDPKMDKERAKAGITGAKQSRLLSQYFAQIYKKLNVRKLSENFPKATEAHKRLLYHPKQPRKVGFIRNAQVKEELTPEEKNIVLAEYDGGKITLKDWFTMLCNIVPPRRPRNMDDHKVVDQLLEAALQTPLLVTEATSLGLDKDKGFLDQVREYEDGRLLNKARSAKQKETAEPTTEQIMAYFNENKETFGVSKSLKIDLIWCEDRPAAVKAKAELDGGGDFEAVKQKYSLEKKVKPFNTQPNSQGLFWKDLWAGDPNQIVGPLKGFHRQGIKWRIVKILEKKDGSIKEYTANMQPQIKDRIMTGQKDALLAKYSEELLRKYPYQIYADKIKDIDPLNIP